MIYKIKDLMRVNRGSSPRPILDYLSPDGYPWLKISDFNFKDRYVYKTKEFIKEAKNTKYVKKGTLVLTNSATPGIPIFLGQDMCLHDGFLYFEDISELIDIEYLFYWFQNYRNNIVGLANGSVFKNLKKEIVENLDIDLPDIEEQKRSVHILSKMDKKIELNNMMKDTYIKIIKNIYDESFKGEYDIVKANEIADITIGKTPARTDKACFTSDKKDMKWISISDLGKCGVYCFESTEMLTPEAIDKYNMKIIPKNTVLLSFKLTVGRTAITTCDSTTNEAIAHFNLKDNSYLYFIYTYLSNFDYSQLGNTSSIGTAVNSKIIKEMPILYPSRENIEKFNDKIKKIFEKVKLIEEENNCLAKIRDTLLDKTYNK